MSKTEDQRKAHVLRIASHFFSLNLSEEKLSSEQHVAVNKFLDSQCPLLVLSRHDSKGAVDFRNEINEQTQTVGRIVFYKIYTEPVSQDNFKQNIMVMSMAGATDSAMYHALHQVRSSSILRSISIRIYSSYSS